MANLPDAFHRLNLSGPYSSRHAISCQSHTPNLSGNEIKAGSEEGSPTRPAKGEPLADALHNPGELSFEEDTAGGMGRHLGITSTTLLMQVGALPQSG